MSYAKLTDHDKDTPTAQKLVEYYTQRLESLRAKNDDTPIEKTEKLRGRIAEVKNILNSLSKDKPFTLESHDPE